ncbi:MAG TPA: hypothetical protein DCY88_08515 [Cyanobacteria bacterium UBA11372]|nr:hypothetical protein [Cyanobacteria bacterium UBA11372]
MPQRTKDWATVLLLNARGLKNEQIAQGLSWALSTVRHTIHRWLSKRVSGIVGRTWKRRKTTLLKSSTTRRSNSVLVSTPVPNLRAEK